eukprot:jgi/Undpi1/3549/HiC_scaffold_16.g06921.m1
MVTPCALRRFWASSSSIERQAGVRAGLVSLIPWWPMTRMLVVVPGGRHNPGVLRKVCNVLDASVRDWCSRRVESYLCSRLLLMVRKSSGKDEVTNSKDARHVFVLEISEATGVDLWLDGRRLKGLVTDACLRDAAQAKLDEQVEKLRADYKGPFERAPPAPKPVSAPVAQPSKEKQKSGSSLSVQPQQQQQQQPQHERRQHQQPQQERPPQETRPQRHSRQPPQLLDQHQPQQKGRFEGRQGEPYATGRYQYHQGFHLHQQGGMSDMNTHQHPVPWQEPQPHYQPPGVPATPATAWPQETRPQLQSRQPPQLLGQHQPQQEGRFEGQEGEPYATGRYQCHQNFQLNQQGGMSDTNTHHHPVPWQQPQPYYQPPGGTAAPATAYPAVPSSGGGNYLGGGVGGVNHATTMNGTPGHFVPEYAGYVADGGRAADGSWGGGGGGGGGGSGWGGDGRSGNAPEHYVPDSADYGGGGDGFDALPGHFVPEYAGYVAGGGRAAGGSWGGGGGVGGGSGGGGGSAPGYLIRECPAYTDGVSVSAHVAPGGWVDGGGGDSGWGGDSRLGNAPGHYVPDGGDYGGGGGGFDASTGHFVQEHAGCDVGVGGDDVEYGGWDGGGDGGGEWHGSGGGL